jgi:hypothetical protein
MNTTIKRFISGGMLVLTLAFSVLGVSTNVSAQALDEACNTDSSSTLCKNRNQGIGPIIKTVVNFLLYLVGIISVIMIIIGGIRYAVSGGDSGAVSAAKNTIFYAIIGLLIAFCAFAIINWVLGRALNLA